MHRSVVAIALMVLVAPALVAQEQRITRGDLPPAVERTVARESEGLTILGFSKETEHGQTTYEMTLSFAGGRTRDITMDAAGDVIEVEEQMGLDSVPPLVLQAITALVGAAPVSRVERIMKLGTVVAYEAHYTVNGQRKELQVGPNGEKLEHEE